MENRKMGQICHLQLRKRRKNKNHRIKKKLKYLINNKIRSRRAIRLGINRKMMQINRLNNKRNQIKRPHNLKNKGKNQVKNLRNLNKNQLKRQNQSKRNQLMKQNQNKRNQPTKQNQSKRNLPIQPNQLPNPTKEWIYLLISAAHPADPLMQMAGQQLKKCQLPKPLPVISQ